MHLPLLQNEALKGGRNPSPPLLTMAGRLIPAPHVAAAGKAPSRLLRGAGKLL